MRLRHTLPLATLLAMPALAQDAHFGLHAGLNIPQGDAKDFVDSKSGYTVGLLIPIQFDGGHTVRPRLDFSSASGTMDLGGGASSDNKVTTTDVGLDYLYNFSGKAGSGPYLFVGVEYAETKVSSTVTIPSLGAGAGDDTANTFGWGAGAGWNFTHLIGAELRYSSTSPDFGGGSVTNNALTLSVTFTF